MKQLPLPLSLSISALLLLSAASSSPAQLTTLTWDGNLSASGVQNGNGAWNTNVLNLRWDDGVILTPNLPWPVILGGLFRAQFGTGAGSGDYTVTVQAVPVNDIYFAGPAHYSLNEGTISLAFPGLGLSNHIDVVTGTTGTINSSINGAITNGALLMNGGGTLVFGGNNDFQSDDTLQVGNVTLRAASATALDEAVLELHGPNAVFEAGVDGLSFSNAVRLTGAATANQISVGSGRSMTLSGAITNGSSAGGFTKTGGGTLTLSGASTYTGATTVSAGTLRIASTGSLISSTTVNTGASLEVAGSINGSLSASGNLSVAATGAIHGPLTINSAAQVAGLLDGAVTVASTGVLTMNQGTATGAVSVAGVLKGSGEIDGTTTVKTGGSLVIDNGLTLDGGLHLEQNARLVFTLGADPLEINGAITLDGTSPIVLDLQGTATGELAFLDLSGVTNAAELPDNFFVLGNLPAHLQGSTLVRTAEGWGVVAVPEPTSAALLLAGVALTMFRRRAKAPASVS